MSLDVEVVIATYQRCELLRNALESLNDAEKPSGLSWSVTVVDNNSRDATKQVVETFSALRDNVKYLFEPRQGKSCALNAAIRASTADVIAMIDDDERVASNWFTVLAHWMADPTIDFVGGAYLPLLRSKPPGWFGPGLGGIAMTDGFPEQPVQYGIFSGCLMGGNSALRRRVFELVGLYPEDLKRCVDHHLTLRVIAAGLRGFYVPELIIYHEVPPQRLVKQYQRRWSVRRGASLYFIDRSSEEPQHWKSIGRIPRWMIGDAIRAVPGVLFGSSAHQRFKKELEIWSLAGYVYGAYFEGYKKLVPLP